MKQKDLIIREIVMILYDYFTKVFFIERRVNTVIRHHGVPDSFFISEFIYSKYFFTNQHSTPNVVR